jgi:hypothetical protein
MRIRSQLQLYFKPQSLSTRVSLGLEEASKLLDSLPEYKEILNRVLIDITPGKDSLIGRPGMTAEQFLESIFSWVDIIVPTGSYQS